MGFALKEKRTYEYESLERRKKERKEGIGQRRKKDEE